MLPAVVVKEFNTWLRARATYAVLMLLALSATVIVLAAFGALMVDGGVAPPTIGGTARTGATPLANFVGTYRAPLLFLAAAVALLTAIALVAPAVAASGINGEKAARTYEMLVLSGLRPLTIATGKLVAATSFVVLLASVALPLFSIAWLFGGVAWDVALATFFFLTLSAVLFTALGLLFSALVASPLVAALYAYLVVGLLLFGTLGIYAGAAALGLRSAGALVLLLNPMLALLSLFQPLADQAGPLLSPGLRALLGQPTFPFVDGVLAFPRWYGTAGLYAGGSLLLLLATAWLLEPTHSLDRPLRPPPLADQTGAER